MLPEIPKSNKRPVGLTGRARLDWIRLLVFGAEVSVQAIHHPVEATAKPIEERTWRAVYEQHMSHGFGLGLGLGKARRGRNVVYH